jgi:hypothetical protein
LCPNFYKFKELVERYSLLKALRSDLLTITRETTWFYSGLGIKGDDLKAEDIVLITLLFSSQIVLKTNRNI